MLEIIVKLIREFVKCYFSKETRRINKIVTCFTIAIVIIFVIIIYSNKNLSELTSFFSNLNKQDDLESIKNDQNYKILICRFENDDEAVLAKSFYTNIKSKFFKYEQNNISIYYYDENNIKINTVVKAENIAKKYNADLIIWGLSNDEYVDFNLHFSSDSKLFKRYNKKDMFFKKKILNKNIIYNDEIESLFFYAVAESKFKNKEYDKSVDYYNKSINGDDNNLLFDDIPIKDMVHYKISKCYVYSGRYELAKIEIMKIKNFECDEKILKYINSINIISSMFNINNDEIESIAGEFNPKSLKYLNSLHKVLYRSYNQTIKIDKNNDNIVCKHKLAVNDSFTSDGMGGDNNDDQYIYKIFDNFGNNGKAVLENFNKIQDKNFESYDFLKFYALSHSSQKDAARYYDQFSYKLNDRLFLKHFLNVVVNLDIGNIKEAVKEYDYLKKENGESKFLKKLFGDHFYNKKDYEKAFSFYEDVIDIKTNDQIFLEIYLQCAFNTKNSSKLEKIIEIIKNKNFKSMNEVNYDKVLLSIVNKTEYIKNKFLNNDDISKISNLLMLYNIGEYDKLIKKSQEYEEEIVADAGNKARSSFFYYFESLLSLTQGSYKLYNYYILKSYLEFPTYFIYNIINNDLLFDLDKYDCKKISEINLKLMIF